MGVTFRDIYSSIYSLILTNFVGFFFQNSFKIMSVSPPILISYVFFHVDYKVLTVVYKSSLYKLTDP